MPALSIISLFVSNQLWGLCRLGLVGFSRVTVRVRVSIRYVRLAPTGLQYHGRNFRPTIY